MHQGFETMDLSMDDEDSASSSSPILEGGVNAVSCELSYRLAAPKPTPLGRASHEEKRRQSWQQRSVPTVMYLRLASVLVPFPRTRYNCMLKLRSAGRGGSGKRLTRPDDSACLHLWWTGSESTR